LAAGDQLVVQHAGKLTDRVICHFEKAASKFVKIGDAPLRTRAANGQKVLELKAKDEVIGFTRIDDLVEYWEKS
jgi:hypothetical protein